VTRLPHAPLVVAAVAGPLPCIRPRHGHPTRTVWCSPATTVAATPSPLHQQRQRPISASPAWSCHRGAPAAASPGPFPSGSGTHHVAISIPMVAAPPGVAQHHKHKAITSPWPRRRRALPGLPKVRFIHEFVLIFSEVNHPTRMQLAIYRTMQEGHGRIDIQSMNMHN
jgi:hypothetical protein